MAANPHKLLEKHVEKGPRELILEGDNFVALKKYWDAAGAYARAAETDKQNPDPFFKMAQALLALGPDYYKDAAVAFNRAVTLYKAGNAGQAEKPLPGAEKEVRELIEKGDALLAENEHKKAATIYAMAAMKDSRNVKAFLGLGKALLAIGHYDDAAVVLEAVYMLEPTNSNGYECAKALRLAGREADANKLLAGMAQAESA